MPVPVQQPPEEFAVSWAKLFSGPGATPPTTGFFSSRTPDRLPDPPPSALVAAKELDDVSERRIDTPVRKTFIRTIGDTKRPPLATIYSGGRGGSVAIKLYLGLLWLSSSAPYESNKSAQAWATLLGLPDPGGLGLRRVNNAFKTLERNRLISSRARPGYPKIVSLLDESTSGRPYQPPSTAYAKAVRGDRAKAEVDLERYFKVSRKLWTEGYIQELTGPGLVFLLALLAEQAGEGKQVWFSTTAFKDRYWISHQTRTDGTKDLLELGLLKIERRLVSIGPLDRTFDMKRKRNIYSLHGAALYRS